MPKYTLKNVNHGAFLSIFLTKCYNLPNTKRGMRIVLARMEYIMKSLSSVRDDGRMRLVYTGLAELSRRDAVGFSFSSLLDNGPSFQVR